MPYGWVAAAVAVSGLASAYSANRAGQQQADAANKATASQQEMFNLVNQQAAPYRQAGYGALSQLNAGLGIPNTQPKSLEQIENELRASGAFAAPAQRTEVPDPSSDTGFRTIDIPGTVDEAGLSAEAQRRFAAQPQPQVSPDPQFLHQFNANDLGTNLSPSYNFMLQQGLGATQNALNAGGGNISGNTLRGMTQFATDYAGTGYQQAFENYTANQTNIFNRLADIAGLGQTANQSIAGAGATMSGSIANSMMQAGAARAGGTVGASNALTGGATNAASWYAMPQMIKSMQTPTASAGGDASGAGAGPG